MYEHVNRFLGDTRPKIRDSYNGALGSVEWRTTRLAQLLSEGLNREEAVVELFRERLKTVGQYKYVLCSRIRRSTAERTHFYLFYGTRHQRGLTEFRAVERKAAQAEEPARIQAKSDKQLSSSGEPPLFAATDLDRPRPIEVIRAPEITKAQSWLRSQIAARGWMTYTSAMEGALERFALTEPELKDALLAIQADGDITFAGMKARARKPSEGVTIQSALQKI